jgi:hypothetical protein
MRALGVAVACAALLAVGTFAAAAGAQSFTDPVRLGFEEGDDWEPSLAADRSGRVYAFWNHYGDDPSPLCSAGCASPHMELQISSNGGTTWGAPRPLIPNTPVEHHDPQIVVDPVDGHTLYTGFMQGSKSSMFVARSNDSGTTWDVHLVEELQRGTDKDILAVRGDYVVLVWNAVMKIYASVSRNGGETWKTVNIAPATTSKLGWSLPSGGAIDKNGNAYFAWSGYEANGKPSGNVNLFVTKSSDGGATWTTKLIDVSGAPPPCDCGGWAYWGAQISLAVDKLNHVYVLYNKSETKFGLNRIYFRRSSDGGTTWTARRDVSGAPGGSNNLFPYVIARGDGKVRIAWQDDRNGFDSGGDDPSARWNTYYRSSADKGKTWSSEVQLSQFEAGYDYKLPPPNDGYLEPYGDYFELDFDADGKVHALWGEGPSYAGPGNVWYARER